MKTSKGWNLIYRKKSVVVRILAWICKLHVSWFLQGLRCLSARGVAVKSKRVVIYVFAALSPSEWWYSDDDDDDENDENVIDLTDYHKLLFCLFLLFLYQDLQDKTFLEVINRYVEVHATVGGGVSTLSLA